MYDVFLSYKREDRPKIEKIVLGLQKVGLKVWFDARTRISVEFLEEINNSLNDSKCVVVAWSKLSVQSKFVRSEAYHAYERDRLVPILIDDVAVPVPFNAIQAADFRKWDGTDRDSSWAILREAVESYAASASKSAVADVALPDEARASKTRPVDEIGRFVKTILKSAGRPMPSGTLLQILRTTYPDEVEAFNYFGFARYRELLDALGPSGISFDPKPPGLISIGKSAAPPKKADQPATTRDPPDAPKAIAVNAEQALPDKSFVERLFEITDAPLLDAKRYRLVFGAIAFAIKHNPHNIVAITKAARDHTIQKGTAISRDKINYVYKGALIGGLKVDEAFITAEKVGLAFAQALHGQCGGYGWELSAIERDQLLAVLGLSDVS